MTSEKAQDLGLHSSVILQMTPRVPWKCILIRHNAHYLRTGRNCRFVNSLSRPDSSPKKPGKWFVSIRSASKPMQTIRRPPLTRIVCSRHSSHPITYHLLWIDCFFTPPCSPGLDTSDFWLLSQLKKYLGLFTDEEVQSKVSSSVRLQSTYFFGSTVVRSKTFRNS